ncbi:MAG TPA: PEP-CTERM sorting domain-containing protein [Bryobacteraceae bacterium]|nr:PEP-CTERM sorting domain-containing protein [Bryobacteraceae bacterium]
MPSAPPGGNPTFGTAETDALTAIGYNAVPEPAAWSLAGAGFVLLLIRRRRAA